MTWRLLVGLGAAASVGGCLGPCDDEIVARIASPDGRKDALVFVRNCGATTDLSTQVSIVAANGSPTEGVVVFVAESDEPGARRASWGGPWAEARWLSERELLVRYDRLATLFRNEAQEQEVGVRFEGVEH